MGKRNMGPLYVFIGAFLWSFAGICTKYLPWNALSIAALRGLIAGATIAVVRRSVKVKLNFPTIAGGVCMGATTVLFMYANKMTTAANAVVLQYTAPIFVILLTMFVLKKKPKPLEIVTVLVTTLGVLLFFLDSMSPGAFAGDLIALIAGCTFAGVFFFGGFPGAEPRDASFLGCVITAALVPCILFDKNLMSGEGGVFPWLVILFLGVVQLGAAYYLVGKGLETTAPVTSSIISTIEPILNPIWVFLALGERPGFISGIGAAIVIGTVAVYNVIEKRRSVSAGTPWK